MPEFHDGYGLMRIKLVPNKIETRVWARLYAPVHFTDPLLYVLHVAESMHQVGRPNVQVDFHDQWHKWHEAMAFVRVSKIKEIDLKRNPTGDIMRKANFGIGLTRTADTLSRHGDRRYHYFAFTVTRRSPAALLMETSIYVRHKILTQEGEDVTDVVVEHQGPLLGEAFPEPENGCPMAYSAMEGNADEPFPFEIPKKKPKPQQTQETPMTQSKPFPVQLPKKPEITTIQVGGKPVRTVKIVLTGGKDGEPVLLQTDEDKGDAWHHLYAEAKGDDVVVTYTLPPGANLLTAKPPEEDKERFESVLWEISQDPPSADQTLSGEDTDVHVTTKGITFDERSAEGAASGDVFSSSSEISQVGVVHKDGEFQEVKTPKKPTQENKVDLPPRGKQATMILGSQTMPPPTSSPLEASMQRAADEFELPINTGDFEAMEQPVSLAGLDLDEDLSVPDLLAKVDPNRPINRLPADQLKSLQDEFDDKPVVAGPASAPASFEAPQTRPGTVEEPELRIGNDVRIEAPHVRPPTPSSPGLTLPPLARDPDSEITQPIPVMKVPEPKAPTPPPKATSLPEAPKPKKPDSAHASGAISKDEIDKKVSALPPVAVAPKRSQPEVKSVDTGVFNTHAVAATSKPEVEPAPLPRFPIPAATPTTDPTLEVSPPAPEQAPEAPPVAQASAAPPAAFQIENFQFRKTEPMPLAAKVEAEPEVPPVQQPEPTPAPEAEPAKPTKSFQDILHENAGGSPKAAAAEPPKDGTEAFMKEATAPSSEPVSNMKVTEIPPRELPKPEPKESIFTKFKDGAKVSLALLMSKMKREKPKDDAPPPENVVVAEPPKATPETTPIPTKDTDRDDRVVFKEGFSLGNQAPAAVVILLLFVAVCALFYKGIYDPDQDSKTRQIAKASDTTDTSASWDLIKHWLGNDDKPDAGTKVADAKKPPKEPATTAPTKPATNTTASTLIEGCTHEVFGKGTTVNAVRVKEDKREFFSCPSKKGGTVTYLTNVNDEGHPIVTASTERIVWK